MFACLVRYGHFNWWKVNENLLQNDPAELERLPGCPTRATLPRNEIRAGPKDVRTRYLPRSASGGVGVAYLLRLALCRLSLHVDLSAHFATSMALICPEPQIGPLVSYSAVSSREYLTPQQPMSSLALSSRIIARAGMLNLTLSHLPTSSSRSKDSTSAAETCLYDHYIV